MFDDWDIICQNNKYLKYLTNNWFKKKTTKHLAKNLFPLNGLHEDVGPRVWQSESHQTASDQHGRRQQDGNGFGDANQRAEDQVAQHGRQLAQGVAEAEARAPGNNRRS